MKKYNYKYIITALAAGTLLIACEQEDQLKVAEGNQIAISGKGTVRTGSKEVKYLVANQDLNKTYEWTLNGEKVTTDEYGYLYLDFLKEGENILTVKVGDLQDEKNISVVTDSLIFGATSEIKVMEDNVLSIPLILPNEAMHNTTVKLAITDGSNMIESKKMFYFPLDENDKPVKTAINFDQVENTGTIPAEYSEALVELHLKDNELVESTRQIDVKLEMVTTDQKEGENTVVAPDSTQLAEVSFLIEDDLKQIAFESLDTVEIAQNSANAGNYYFNVVLAHPSEKAVEVTYNVSAGAAEGVNTYNQSTLFFAPGEQSKQIAIGLEEGAFANEQIFSIDLTAHTSDDAEVELVEDQSIKIDIKKEEE